MNRIALPAFAFVALCSVALAANATTATDSGVKALKTALKDIGIKTG